jgi:hypothetical protein
MTEYFTLLNISINVVVFNTYVIYNVVMATNNKILNKFEKKLQEDIENLMKDKDVKFSVFLPVLRNDMPEEKSSNDYKNKHKAEYLKQLRASYSVDEVVKMLNVLGLEIKFSIDGHEIIPAKYVIPNVKVKYSELMAVCELLGIRIDWVEAADRTSPNAVYS